MPRFALVFLFGLAGAIAAGAASPVSFNRDIRPIMADTCFRCHGPDKNSRMANLRLDLRDEAVKPNRKGDTPIVPGNAKMSLVVKRIFSANQAMVMPPRSSHKELTAAQKETIRRWIDEGAVYEGHWSYQPVMRPTVPEGAANAIDAFVRQRLAAAGLAPAAEAEKRTLLRRVTLDLTGLPPTPEETKAFLADNSAEAYERVVQRLIDSDRYAEKQAIYWLDAVRYADTCGFHGDNAFPAWPFRDYVLRSLKANKPFDQFTREQLAGDLLPGATEESRVASAFNRLTRTSAEGGLQPKEYLAKYAADRVRTISSVWLGSTMGCAECHDHKFDPILTRDFYSMKAFFADVKETGLVPDQGEKAWGELLMLPDAAQKQAWAATLDKITAAKNALEARRASLVSGAAELWAKRVAEEVKDWVVQYPIAASTRQGAKLTLHKNEPVLSIFDFGGSVVNETKPANGLIVASGPNPDNETYVLTLKPGAGTWHSLGLEVISDDRLPGARLARGSDRLVATDVEASVGAGKTPLKFARARSNMLFWDAGLTPWNAIDGNPETGWGAATYRTFRTAFLALDFAEPVTTTATSTITVAVHHDSAYRRAVSGRFRIALAASALAQPIADRTQNPTIPGLTAELRKAIESEPAKRTEQQADEIRALVDSTHPELAPLWNELSRLESERAVLRAQIPQVVATVAAEPGETRILARGNFMDESGPVVEPAIPQFLGKLNTNGRATRLDLANWLVSRDNPLTARVYVNRVWRQLFGTGLTKSLEDLGSQGEWPTHPELLDWLAAEFMQNWDMKHIVRSIVTSQTYRQSSVPSKEALEKDPDNRLLSRQSRLRVDAEMVRDIALAASGLLSERFGGPSVRPYQPEGYLAALNFPKRDYSESRGADLYRRGLYSFWQRTFLHPSMAAFDAPTREECTVNRTGSNTPLQSLVLLNDKTFVEAARVFAQRMLADGGRAIDKRIEFAFERALNRAPAAGERAILRDLYVRELARFRAAPKDAAALVATGEAPLPSPAARVNAVELAATTSVARAILNLHETITRN